MADKQISDFAVQAPVAADFFVFQDASTGLFHAVHPGVASGLALLDSAGMPIDSSARKIVDSNSNTNGDYVQFADGTMDCWQTFTTPNAAGTFTASSLGGVSMYYYAFSSWTFPVAFTAAPAILATVIRGGVNHMVTAYGSGAPSATACPAFVINSLADESTNPVTLYLLARGSWY